MTNKIDPATGAVVSKYLTKHLAVPEEERQYIDEGEEVIHNHYANVLLHLQRHRSDLAGRLLNASKDPFIILRAAELAHEANTVQCQLRDHPYIPTQALMYLCEHDGKPEQGDDDVYCEEFSRTQALNQLASAVDGVLFRLDNPNSTPKDSHDNWLKFKLDSGWVYGAVKDENAKTHPCIVPYEELPEEQRIKDTIYQNIVSSILLLD